MESQRKVRVGWRGVWERGLIWFIELFSSLHFGWVSGGWPPIAPLKRENAKRRTTHSFASLKKKQSSSSFSLPFLFVKRVKRVNEFMNEWSAAARKERRREWKRGRVAQFVFLPLVWWNQTNASLQLRSNCGRSSALLFSSLSQRRRKEKSSTTP